MGLKTGWLKCAMMIILGVLMGGCAATQEKKTIKKEQMLAAAGFHVKLADTPKKLDHLKGLPQRRVFRKELDGKVYYIYADGGSCKCLYVGTEKAYQKYQDMLEQMEMAKEDIEEGEMYRDTEMNWGLWAPLDPLY